MLTDRNDHSSYFRNAKVTRLRRVSTPLSWVVRDQLWGTSCQLTNEMIWIKCLVPPTNPLSFVPACQAMPSMVGWCTTLPHSIDRDQLQDDLDSRRLRPRSSLELASHTPSTLLPAPHIPWKTVSLHGN